MVSGAGDFVSEDEVRELEKIIGHRFRERDFLLKAVSHRAFLGTSNRKTLENQRLEFLGDSILTFLISRHLIEKYPGKDEGFLSKLRAKIVDNRFLADLGSEIGIEDVLSRARNRRKRSSARLSRKVMGDIFESIVGALYLDGGEETVESFVEKEVIRRISNIEEIEVDFKTSLQEWCQGKGKPLPLYSLLYSKGPEHDKSFVVSVSVDSVGKASGEGRSKKEAEQNAARKLFSLIKEQA